MKKEKRLSPQEITSLEIKLWGKTVGYLAISEGKIIFEYDEAFKNTKLELSPSELPLSTTAIYSSEKTGATFKGLPGIFADSLPDIYGLNIINNYFFKHFGIPINQITPLMSLAYIANRSMGALEYYPYIQDKVLIKDEILSLNRLVDAAKENLSGKASDVVSELIRVGTSAGGLKAKATIDYNPTTDEIRSGFAQVKEGFIPCLIKFDGVMDGEFAGYNGKNEYIYNLIAADCGIKVPFCYLIEGPSDDDLPAAHFITSRFDRDEEKNKPYHVSTFCGLTLFDFRLFNSSSYESLLRWTKGLCSGDVTHVEEIFRRCVFNVVLKNEDDHTKNFSFLMDQNGQWSVSPAYDLNYVPTKHGHQLSINEKNKNILIEDLFALAASIDIKRAKAIRIIEEVENSARKYLTFAKEVSLPMDYAKGVFRYFNFLTK